MTRDESNAGDGGGPHEVQLTDPPRLPRRIAFGFLSGGFVGWMLLFVLLPPVLLVGSLAVDSRLAGLAVGLPAFLSLSVWWTGYRYQSPHVTLDSADGTIQIEPGRTPAWTGTRTIDLGEVDGATIVPLGEFALVRLDYRGLLVLQPHDFVVPQSERAAVESVLRACGVAVSTPGDEGASRWQATDVPVRIVLTPLVLVAVPAAAIWTFGTTALWNDVVVVAGIVLAWTLQAHATTVVGLRPSRNSLAFLADVLATGAVAFGLGWLYLQAA